MSRISIATSQSGSIRDGIASTPGQFGIEPSFFEPEDPVLERSRFKELFQTTFSISDVFWFLRFVNRSLSSRAPFRFHRHSRWKISMNVRVPPRFTIPSMTTREYLAGCWGKKPQFDDLCERCCSILDGRITPSVSTHFPELFAMGLLHKQAVDALRTVFGIISAINRQCVEANRVRVICISLGNRVDKVRCVPLNPNTAPRRSHRYAFRATFRSKTDAQVAALSRLENIVDFLPEKCNLAIRIAPDPMGLISDWSDVCSMDALLTSDSKLSRVGFDCDFGSLARIIPSIPSGGSDPFRRILHARLAVTGKGDFPLPSQFRTRDLENLRGWFKIYKEATCAGVATGFVTINMPKGFWPGHFAAGIENVRRTLEPI